ncbi:MAG TPA: DUF5060 domain-containing protein, partial [Thermoanaerobaculia bacterium]|nr:DUF5060 domain-containing protein [Thermoanaerobaculia bacterium]
MTLTCCLLFLTAAASAQTTAKTNQRWEVALSTPYTFPTCNPWHDANVTVTYTAPDGVTQYAGYAFWDGPDPAIPGNTLFRIRAMFPSGGRWTWATSEASDACGGTSSVSQSGYVDVTASGGGQVSIYTQGPLKVNSSSSPARYLTH